MNDTKKTLNKSTVDCSNIETKLHNLLILLTGLNAYGSLSLNDLKLIEDYIKGAFDYALLVDSEE